MNLHEPLSQPIIYEPRLSRTMSEPSIKKRREGISSVEAEQKIHLLENYIENAIRINEEDEDEYTADEVDTQIEPANDTSRFFYFIGRLNPPHNGHIKALKTLIEMAQQVGSIPLILLGSGPKGERTLDNPIPYETKKAFIESVLPGNYIIQEMKNPAQQISSYIREGLREIGENIDNISNIEINHIAGGKDEDTTKLSFALESASKTAKSILPEANVTTGVSAIEAETVDGDVSMSATKVRKDAYQSILDGTGLDSWGQKYGEFYSELTPQIYEDIVKTVDKLEPSEKNNILQHYITYGEILKPLKQSKKRKGGNKRTRNKKNRSKKRRYSRKNKR